MHVTRLGLTPLKGARHRRHEAIRLDAAGPVGDRVFCLVDADEDRCLRTVENPSLLRADAAWDGETLVVDLPSGRHAGRPSSTGRERTVDYWGRQVPVTVVDGPWSAAFSEPLGREVVLCRAAPSAVVYAAPVTLVTSSSLARLAQAVGAPVAGARFRATIELETGSLPAHVEDGWEGRLLRLGTAELRVGVVVPRCAVVDLGPRSGVPDLDVLKTLATYRRHPDGIAFGVYAEVTRPGRVAHGDRAVLVD